MTSAGDLVASRYRIERLLGQGAMGQVWLAQDELLHRQVAIKQLLLDPTTGQGSDVDRAVREARLASRLNHPNAVAVHDLLMNDGRPMLVMEYVDGKHCRRGTSETPSRSSARPRWAVGVHPATMLGPQPRVASRGRIVDRRTPCLHRQNRRTGPRL